MTVEPTSRRRYAEVLRHFASGRLTDREYGKLADPLIESRDRAIVPTTVSVLTRAAPLLLLALVFPIVGCTVSDRDVSRDPHFLVGYRPGKVYELVRPVTLLRVERGYYELLPPGETREYGKPAGTLA